MPGKHAPKYLPDGEVNPRWRPQGPRTHPRERGPKVKELPLAWSASFIGIDGEGLTPSDPERPQPYAFLAASTGAERWNARGLSTETCLDFLAGLATTHRRSIFVVFGASYDFNQWLRDLPRRDLERLWTGERVTWWSKGRGRGSRYELELRMRKSLTIRRFGDPAFVRAMVKGRRVWRANFSASLTVWDVFGFFQSTFLDALTKYMTPEELTRLDFARIRAGKARRSQFTKAEKPMIRQYTRAELRALVALSTSRGRTSGMRRTMRPSTSCGRRSRAPANSSRSTLRCRMPTRCGGATTSSCACGSSPGRSRSSISTSHSSAASRGSRS